MKNRLRIFTCMFAFVFLTYLTSPAQTSGYKLFGKIILGGENRWDYLSVDETYHRLFVSNNTKVHVIDLNKNTVVGEIDGLVGVHGIAFAPEFNKGFITSGRDSNVVVFDLKSLKVLSKVKICAKNPDAILYDPFLKTVFSMNHSSGSVTAIEPSTGKILGTVELGGTAEFAASNLQGKMYVNLEDKSEVCVIDTKNLKVVDKWNLAPCESPTGMAIDNKHNRLFVTGGNQMMAVIDLASGKVIKTLPIGKGVDGCAFDPETGFALSSNGRSGTITAIRENSPDDFSVVDNINTSQGARTITVDEQTHKVYSSTMLPVEGSDQKSFGVLVLDYNAK